MIFQSYRTRSPDPLSTPCSRPSSPETMHALMHILKTPPSISISGPVRTPHAMLYTKRLGTLRREDRTLDHSYTTHLCKIALPQHPVQIFRLLLRKCLHQVVSTLSLQRQGSRETYLQVHLPRVLSGLLEITQDAFHTLAYHPRIIVSFGC